MSDHAENRAVVDSLGRAIATERLAAGQVIRVDQVEAQFGVSRAVAREAMRLLESLGMVALRRRVGATILPRRCWVAFDPRVMSWRLSGPRRIEELDQIMQVRAGVEPIAARLACADLAAGPRLSELVAAMTALAEAGQGDTPEFHSADMAFHQLVLVAGGNDYFTALSEVTSVVLSQYEQLGLRRARPDPRVLDLHAQVAAAVMAGEADTAERASRSLMDEVAAEVLLGSVSQVHREPTIANWTQAPVVSATP